MILNDEPQIREVVKLKNKLNLLDFFKVLQGVYTRQAVCGGRTGYRSM
jgi:hypothetical protein